jgi:hypothetical protein
MSSMVESDDGVMASILSKENKGHHHYRSFSDSFNDIGTNRSNRNGRRSAGMVHDTTTVSNTDTSAHRGEGTEGRRRRYNNNKKKYQVVQRLDGTYSHQRVDTVNLAPIQQQIDVEVPTGGLGTCTGQQQGLSNNTDPELMLNDDMNTSQDMIMRIVNGLDSKSLQHYYSQVSRIAFLLVDESKDDQYGRKVKGKPLGKVGTMEQVNAIDIDAAVDAIFASFDLTELCYTDNKKKSNSTNVVEKENWVTGILPNFYVPGGNPWETITLDPLTTTKEKVGTHFRLKSLVMDPEDMGEVLRLG